MSDEIVLTETNNDAKFDTDTISNTCIIQEYTGNGFSDINAGYIIDTDGDAIGKVGVKTINKCVDIMFFCLKKLVEKETGYTG